MLSVKHISLSGEEHIYLAARIRYTPKDHDADRVSTPATVWVDDLPLTGGTVFVMNDAGKTVARYDIGASMVPLDAAPDPRPYRRARGAIIGRASDVTAEEYSDGIAAAMNAELAARGL